MISLTDVRAAAHVLVGVAHRTPVLTSATLDALVGGTVFCKAEQLQRVGAFKFRGAYHAISRLAPDERARGVLTYSSGNHAQAVALAARLHKVPATILMPADAPEAKVAATLDYGAHVRRFDRYNEDREALGAELAAELGLVIIPPYESPDIMAGQGTAALELLEDVGQLDQLVVCMGGGGLMAGCATAAKGLQPELQMIGVEPAAGDDHRRSLAAGERVRIDVPRTIADALQAETPGALTFEVNRRLVDEVVVVSDGEIVDAMVFAFERMKTVLEPGGAVGLAALLNGRVTTEGRRTGVLLSGGNVGADRFAELVRRA
ncbi:MAG: pyridoxal-phosphate dependent enzyme [Egibacteraceae bacterium]